MWAAGRILSALRREGRRAVPTAGYQWLTRRPTRCGSSGRSPSPSSPPLRCAAFSDAGRGGQRSWWAAVVALVSVAVPVLPLILAIPIRCSDEDAVLDLRIVPLGVGLLGIVGWLAILARLQERAGDTRSDAERKVLGSGALLVPGMLVEYVASAITLAVRCGGTSEPVIAHLAVAAAVFTVVAGSALLRGRIDQ